MNFKLVFPQERPVLIGAIHLPPSPSHANSVSIELATTNALADAHSLIQGGVDGIIFENNYDIPHSEFVSNETEEFMAQIGHELKKETHVPLGVSVLWNDYRTALSLSRTLDLMFIRIPVFVDKVKTAYGTFTGNPEDVIGLRKELGIEHVAIFTDIHVKHSEILTGEPIETTAKRAIEAGSDGLIITGSWTGDAPNFMDLERVRNAVGDFPILCGSGVNEKNIGKLFELANGAIVSTCLKTVGKSHTINISAYENRINEEKVKALVQAMN